MRWAVVTAMLGACATTGLAPPSQGGAEWLELTTPNFVVRTDLDEDVAREEVVRLETLRAALLSTLLPNVDLPTGHLPVIILRNDHEWRTLFRPPIGGLMIEQVLFRPLILHSGAGNVQDIDIVKHELTHFILRLYLKYMPPWFDEGLAAFFETMHIEASRGRVRLGRPSQRYIEARDDMMSIEKVLSYIRAPEDLRFDATSWLLVHYLVYHEPERFATFRRLLQSPATAERAWDTAFADRPLEGIEAAVRDYVENGRYGEIERTFKVPEPTPTVRRLGEIEILNVLAMLDLASLGAGPDDAVARAGALRHIESALRLDATDVEANALAVVAMNERGEALKIRAGAVVAKHQTSWLAWALVAIAAPNDVERAAALERAHALAKDDPAINLERLAH